MTQGQIRQNRTTKEWVIYAPARSKRPRDYVHREKAPSSPQTKDEDCPFCPGNEDMLPNILAQESLPNGKGWQTRVVPNKYPALHPDEGMERTSDGFQISMPGYGKHVVIIESPRHDVDIADLSIEALKTVIHTYQKRYRILMEEEKNNLVILFRNRGARAGTSLEHPHSQLIAVGLVPYNIRMRQQVAQEYYDDWGRCLYCDLLSHEKREQIRVILENPSFLAFVPYAAEVPYEIWIVPKMHQADFCELGTGEIDHFTSALQEVLRCLNRELGDPDYNYVFSNASRSQIKNKAMHWYLQIRPRLITRAGFEIGSGMHINPSIPEEDAARLRGDHG
jgi:UDPglucose--hexose-1-phosphate uridylyltransferase